MNKIFILVFLCFGAYGCDPADPVPNFMDFNDKDHDGALSLQEWMASEVPPGLRVELNLRSGSEFKRPDANHDGKIGLDELGGGETVCKDLLVRRSVRFLALAERIRG